MKKMANKVNTTFLIITFLSLVLTGCKIKHYFLVPENQKLVKQQGYILFYQCTENYFFPMKIDTTKDYYEDFVNHKLKGFRYVFSSCLVNPFELLYKYSEPIDTGFLLDTNFRRYLVPVEIEYIKNYHQYFKFEKLNEKYFKMPIKLNGKTITTYIQVFDFLEISAEPVINYKKRKNKLNTTDTIDYIKWWYKSYEAW